MAQEGVGKLRSRLGGGEAPAVHVAAFGKHPGWNDHIDDLGIDTPELGEIKRLLYSQGIGGVVDAGTWDSLPEEHRLSGFDHWFIWRRGPALSLGRMWSSVDGKGRTKYPMIVCASARGVDASWLVEHAGPALEDLAAACREAPDAPTVIERVAQARARLRAELPAEGASVSGQGETAAAILASCDELGPDRVGLYRVLYQIEREMSAYRPLAGGSTKSVAVRPAQLRVPPCAAEPLWGARQWLRFMREQLAAPSAVLVVAPVGAEWIDIIVGEPGSAQLACIRSGTEAIPLTSDVPYTLEEAFTARADATIARTQEQIDESVGTSGVSALRGAVGSITERLRETTTRTSSSNRKPLLIGIGAVVGVVALTLLAMAVFGGKKRDPDSGSKTPSDGSSTSKQDRVPEPVVESASWKPEDQSRWAAWCRAYEAWVAPLARDLSQADMQRDAHLATVVAPILSRARELDPRSLVQSGTRRLSLLISSPPPEVQKPEAIEATRRAVDEIARLERALSPEAWPTRARAVRVADEMASLGFAAASSGVRALAESVRIDKPEELAPAIAGIIEVSAELDRASEALESFRSATDRIKDAEDPFPAGFTRLALRTFAASAGEDLARATARIKEAAAIATEMAAFMGDGWGLVDQELWERESRTLATDLSDADVSIASRWLAEIRQARFRVPEDPDPRPGLEIVAELGAAQQRIDQLRQGATASESEVLDQIAQRIAAARSRWQDVAGVRWERPTVEHVRAEIDAAQSTLREVSSEIARADLRVAKDLEAYAATLRSRTGVSASGSPTLDQLWRERRDELLAALGAPESFVTLRERIESLEDFIAALDLAIPTGVEMSAAPQSIDRRALAPLIASARERAVARAVQSARWLEEGQFAADQRWRDDLARHVAEHQSWCATVATAIARAAAVERAIDSWRPMSETIAGAGVTAREWLAEARAADASGPLRVACGPLIARLERLDTLAASADAEALFAGGMRSQNGAAAMIAWRRLTTLDGWVRGVGDLERLVGLRDRIGSMLAAANSDDRFRGIAEELTQSGAAAWARAAESAASSASLVEICGSAHLFGGDVSSLTARSRFNLACAALRDDTRLDALSGLEEPALRQKARDAAAALAALGVSDPEATAFIGSLQALAESGEGDGPAVDLTTIGPASKGWAVEEVGDGSVLRFTPPDGGESLEFVRIEPATDAPTNETSFVLRTELSLGVVSRLLAGLGDWEQREEQWAELRDARQGRASDRGARAWKWDGRAATIVAASGWIEPPAGVPAYPDGLNVPAPSDQCPIQAISPAAAAAVAEALGCRLPTFEQWSAAVRTGSGTDRTNLRDATWARQRDHAAQFNAAFKALPAPDAGTFLPTSIRAELGADAVVATPADDGTLWFAPVAEASSGFENLVGNVAEWIRIGDDSGFAVVGGSALSAPDLDPMTPYPIPGHRERSAYSDVGLRLAFVVEGFDPRSALRYRLFRAGRDAPFLPSER